MPIYQVKLAMPHRDRTSMPTLSAGILMYRRPAASLELFLVHPGGPFWMNKDEGAWSIPKGLFENGEDALVAAKREFQEETGFVPDGHFVKLGEFKQPGGKIIHAWSVEGDAVERAGRREQDQAVADVVGDPRGIALERIAVAAAPRQLEPQAVAGGDGLLALGPERRARGQADESGTAFAAQRPAAGGV